jgi:hypothetical protein
MDFIRNNVKVIAILAIVLLAVGVIIVVISGSGGANDRPLSDFNQSGDLLSFSGSSGQNPTASVDPCTLLDANKLEQLLGFTLLRPQSGYADNPLGERYCHYFDNQDSDQIRFNLSVVFESSIDPVLRDNGLTARQMFDGRKASPTLIQSVEGMGGEAFWGGTGVELWNGLHVLVHDVYLQVNVNSGDEELDYRVARNMAVMALERLFVP